MDVSLLKFIFLKFFKKQFSGIFLKGIHKYSLKNKIIMNVSGMKINNPLPLCFPIMSPAPQ